MAHYDVQTNNGLTKWWVTGTGSGSRLSDFMDDTSPAPGLANSNGVWWSISSGWATGAAPIYSIACTTEPDGDSGVDQCVRNTALPEWLVKNIATPTTPAAGEYGWNAGTLYVRLTADANPNSSVTYVYYAWSHFMTEHVVDKSYKIHLTIEIGNGSTATTFVTKKENLHFDEDVSFIMTNNTSVTSGELSGLWGINGSFWHFVGGAATPRGIQYTAGATATLNIYGSMLSCDKQAYLPLFKGGTLTILNSIISGAADVSSSYGAVYPWSYYALTFTMKDVFITNIGYFYQYSINPTLQDIRLHRAYAAIYTTAFETVISDASVTSTAGAMYIQGTTSSVRFINPKATIESVFKDIVGGALVSFSEEYTITLTIVDKDGIPISGATVLLEDHNGYIVCLQDSGETVTTTVTDVATTSINVSNEATFAVNDVIRIAQEYMHITAIPSTLTVSRGTAYTNVGTYVDSTATYPKYHFYTSTKVYKVLKNGGTTDANGQVTFSSVPYKFWFGGSETKYPTTQDAFTYKVIVSKAGYETLTLENITINAPIKWRLELQHARGARLKLVGMGI